MQKSKVSSVEIIQVKVAWTGAPYDLDGLVDRADAIVVGRVVGTPSVGPGAYKGGEDTLYSTFTIAVETTLKGETARTLRVRFMGGATPTRVYLLNSGADLKTDARYLLFLTDPRHPARRRTPLPAGQVYGLADINMGQVLLDGGRATTGKDEYRTIKPWKFGAKGSPQIVGVSEGQAINAVRKAVDATHQKP